VDHDIEMGTGMIARIRKSIDEKDQGFTLIELLVVIIIIGILAAIAIPVFLNQRKKAVDASIKSDLHTVATQLETYYTDNQAYPASGSGSNGSATIGSDDIKLSPNNTINWYVTAASGGSYCIFGSNPNGSGADGEGFSYLSDGGLVSGGAAAPADGCSDS